MTWEISMSDIVIYADGEVHLKLSLEEDTYRRYNHA